MDKTQHFMAEKVFFGKESGKEICWCQEQGGLFLLFNDGERQRKIKAPEIGMAQALESIYNIFADWAVCDFLEEQEFCSFTDQLKKKG